VEPGVRADRRWSGLDACENVLSHGVIETLIMTRSVSQTPQDRRVFSHRNADDNYLTIEKRRQRLLERAIKHGVHIEFVDTGTFLDDYCGVGAILRYRGAEQVAA